MSAFDILSPIAPARIRVLVLPVGKIRRSRFTAFLDSIKGCSEVKLEDVTLEARPDRVLSTLQPTAGVTIFYDFATSEPSQSHIDLSPFEIFHEPCVILGLGDAEEYEPEQSLGNIGENDGPRDPAAQWRHSLDQLREEHSRALVHRVAVFGVKDAQISGGSGKEIIILPEMSSFKTTTVKTVICDLTSTVLNEINASIKAIDALPFVPSPRLRAPDNSPHANRIAPAAETSQIRPISVASDRVGSASPIAHTDSRAHRMSMPVLASSSDRPTSRSSTLNGIAEEGNSHSPARTFDDITGVGATPSIIARANSQDRVSVQGYGPGGQDEFKRNRGRARIGIVCAFRYLQSGRWGEAVSYFSEHGTKARGFGDHIWHAKAIEGIVIGMLLLAWAKLDVHIPSLCSSAPERPASSRNTLANAVRSSLESSSQAPAVASLQDLQAMLPTLVYMILAIHQRSKGALTDALPPLAFSEISVRLALILSALHSTDGYLTAISLQRIVHPDKLFAISSNMTSHIGSKPSRTSICNILEQALPTSEDFPALFPVDTLEVYAGIAALSSYLGLPRKKAFVMGSFVESLSTVYGSMDPHKVETTANQDPATQSLAHYLDELCRIYGVNIERRMSDNQATRQGIQEAGSIPAVKTIGTDSQVSRAFGSLTMKEDILRLCAQLYYAKGDYSATLVSIALLLRQSGPGLPLSTRSNDVQVALSRAEQSVLVEGIVSLSVQPSLPIATSIAEPDYWDDFLIRGVYLTEARPELQLHKRKANQFRSMPISDQIQGAKVDIGPFLHSAFSKAESKENSRLLVAGEEREFVVSLQNPYEFDLEIQSLRVMSQDITIAASRQSLLLRSSRLQSFSIVGSPTVEGKVTIDSCAVKVRGCAERIFPIYVEARAPTVDTKIKVIGLPPAQSRKEIDMDEQVAMRSGLTADPLQAPAVASIQLVIITQQPILVMSATSLPQNAIAISEGRTNSFSVTLKNVSGIAADFAEPSCQDSVSVALSEAVRTKGLSPVDVFLYEEQLSAPALRPSQLVPGNVTIAAGQEFTWRFEIFGRAGLTSASVRFDYGKLGDPKDETVFTRQLIIPFSITVTPVLQISRCEILPLDDTFAMAQMGTTPSFIPCTTPLKINRVDSGIVHGLTSSEDQSSGRSQVGSHDLEHDRVLAFRGAAFALLILDIRNSWNYPVVATLSCNSDVTTKEFDGGPQIVKEWQVTHTIHPGQPERFAIPVHRIYLEHSTMSIQRTLRLANERQFVVSSIGDLPAEVERKQRQRFWHKLILSKLLRLIWTSTAGDQTGLTTLAGMQLNTRSLEAISVGDIAITIRLVSSRDALDNNLDDSAIDTETTVKVDQPFTVRFQLCNRAQHRTIYPLLRIQLRLQHPPPANVQPPNQQQHRGILQYRQPQYQPDISKRLSWSGALQRPLKNFPPGATTTVDVSVCALCSGDYEVSASIEEMKPALDRINDEQAAGRWDDGLHGPVLDQVALGVGRRSWTASQVVKFRAVNDIMIQTDD